MLHPFRYNKLFLSGAFFLLPGHFFFNRLPWPKKQHLVVTTSSYKSYIYIWLRLKDYTTAITIGYRSRLILQLHK